jgi:hypothetical protein
MPLLGLSGVASAAKKGSAGWCAAHPARAKKAAACSGTAGGGGSGSGSGSGAGPVMTIQIDPSPVVETSTSSFAAVIQVETSPTFAGDTVDVESSQLQASCADVGDVRPRNAQFLSSPSVLIIPLVLDDDGNATTDILGLDCAPGTDLIDADMAVAPFATVLGTLVLSPPAVTAPGLFGAPTSSGTVTTGEVETGDTAASGDSDVYAVFNVETDPVYAEQPVEFSLNELFSRCLLDGAWTWFSPNTVNINDPGTGGQIQPPITTTLDDDGNATLIFAGRSCAAGSSEVTADVMAGSHPTYVTSFTIDPPQPTT